MRATPYLNTVSQSEDTNLISTPTSSGSQEPVHISKIIEKILADIEPNPKDSEASK